MLLVGAGSRFLMRPSSNIKIYPAKSRKNGGGKRFKEKDLGPLKYFLGIEVARSRKELGKPYLKKIGMLGCKPTSTPIDPNYNFGNENTMATKRNIRD